MIRSGRVIDFDLDQARLAVQRNAYGQPGTVDILEGCGRRALAARLEPDPRLSSTEMKQYFPHY